MHEFHVLFNKEVGGFIEKEHLYMSTRYQDVIIRPGFQDTESNFDSFISF